MKTIFLFLILFDFTFSQIDSLEEKNFEQLNSEEESIDFFERKKISIHFRTRAIQNLQTEKEFSEKTYLGSKIKMLNQLSLNIDDLSCGILLEKDKGEKKFNDFTSFYIEKIFFENFNATVGDYDIEFGEGLLLWKGFSFSKGENVLIPFKKNSRGILPHKSSDEINFFRGGSFNLKNETFNIGIFFSNKKVHGTVDSTNKISGFNNVSYFRTTSELKYKNAISEKTFGLILNYNYNKDLNFGISIFKNSFDKNFAFEKFGFEENSFFSSSLHFKHQTNISKTKFEIAKSIDFSTIGNLEFFPTRNFNFIFSFRNYQSNFFAPHGNSLSVTYDRKNEQGFYFGGEIKPIPKWKFFFYFDNFYFPNNSLKKKFSKNGFETLIGFETNKFQKINLKFSTTQKILFEEIEIKKLKFRFTFEYKPHKNLILKERFEVIKIIGSQSLVENGFLLYNDVSYKLSDNFFSSFRAIIFDTKSFDTKITQLEKDVDGAVTLPFLYEKGIRWYLFLNYEMLENFLLQTKFAFTEFDSPIKNLSETVALQVEFKY